MRIVTTNQVLEEQLKKELEEWSDLDIDMVESDPHVTQEFAFHFKEQALPQIQAFFQAHVRPMSSPTQLMGKKKNGRVAMIKLTELYFIEAIGREVFAYTKDEGIQLKQKLYELESLSHVCRINKSTIVNILQVDSLLSLLNGKLLLTLNDGQELEVSRKYVKGFKHYLKEGIGE